MPHKGEDKDYESRPGHKKEKDKKKKRKKGKKLTPKEQVEKFLKSGRDKEEE